jgi:hypothetical protein
MSKIILALAFLVFLIVIGPIASIWALNTLFPVLNIPLDFNHWLAAAVLMAVVKTTVERKV